MRALVSYLEMKRRRVKRIKSKKLDKYTIMVSSKLLVNFSDSIEFKENVSQLKLAGDYLKWLRKVKD